MARHYKQTRKDRRDESRGMKRYERHHHDRERHHDSDALMMPHDSAENHGMHEDTQMYHMGRSYYGPGYGHPSNLPPYPDMKYYPKEHRYLHTDNYPDTIREIDHDDADATDRLNHQPSDSMY